MKPILLTTALIATGLAALAPSASAATTDPVGYITITINGNTAGNPSGAATYIAPSLVQPTEFTGLATASPSGTTTINFASGVPATLDDTYLLEIADGASEGWWTAVVSSTTTSITVSGTFPAALAADVRINVRKFETLKGFLGANDLGLSEIDGVNTVFDEVQILDPVAQSVKTAVYVTTAVGVPVDGWYNLVTETSLDDEVIFPGTAVKVIRHAATPLEAVTTGNVKLTKTMVDIFPRSNWISQPLAAGGTMGEMQLATQLIQFDGARASDELQTLNTDQSANVFVALDPTIGMGEIMANLVTEADATNVVLAEGAGYVVKRDAAQSPSSITIPAQTVAP